MAPGIRSAGDCGGYYNTRSISSCNLGKALSRFLAIFLVQIAVLPLAQLRSCKVEFWRAGCHLFEITRYWHTSYIQMRKVLVTGGAGALSVHTWSMPWSNAGMQVRVLDNLSTGRLENLELSRNKIDFLEADLTDPVAVARRCFRHGLHFPRRRHCLGPP